MHPIELEPLIKRLSNGIDDDLAALVNSYHSSNIAAVIDELDRQQAESLLKKLPTDKVGMVLSHLSEGKLKTLASWFDIGLLASFLVNLPTDDVVDILNVLSVEQRENILDHFRDEGKVRDIKGLLPYEDGTAGGLMQKEMITVNVRWTVPKCIAEIKKQQKQVDKILTIYVVDDSQQLLGRIPIKQLMFADEEKVIHDLYISNIISVEVYSEVEQVIEYMEQYDLEAIPVVSSKGKLIGRITFDDVMEVMSKQAKSNTKAMAGITQAGENEEAFWVLIKSRIPWLLVGIGGGLLGAQFISFFEADLILLPAMAFFIPLINATGGNVGIQSSAIIIQKLSRESVQNIEFQRLISKGVIIAVTNGLIISTTVFLFNLFFTRDYSLILIVSISIFCVTLLASLMGTLTPIFLDKMNLNPALAAGPFITTANDLMGLLVYFTTANLML